MAEVSVSVLDVEEENAINVFYNIETAKIDYFHIDVMDGEFVKKDNVLQMRDYALKITSVSMTPIDVHLMVNNPKEHLDYFIDLGVNRITFHYEACSNKDEIISIAKYLNENRVRVGIAVNPDTKIEEIFDVLPYIHMVLVMSVVPGKGGQKFIPETLDKVEILRKYCEENDLDMDIEVDGGINDETGKEAVEAGANILVSGNYVLNADDYKEAINNLKNL